MSEDDEDEAVAAGGSPLPNDGQRGQEEEIKVEDSKLREAK